MSRTKHEIYAIYITILTSYPSFSLASSLSTTTPSISLTQNSLEKTIIFHKKPSNHQVAKISSEIKMPKENKNKLSTTEKNNNPPYPFTSCLKYTRIPLILGEFDYFIVGNNNYSKRYNSLTATFNLCTGTWEKSRFDYLSVSHAKYKHARSSRNAVWAYIKTDQVHNIIYNNGSKINRFNKGPLSFSEEDRNVNGGSDKHDDQSHKNNTDDHTCLIKAKINICSNYDDGTFCAPLKDSYGNYVTHEISMNICDSNWIKIYNNSNHYYNLSERYFIDSETRNRNTIYENSDLKIKKTATPNEKKIFLSRKNSSLIHKGQMMEMFPVPPEVLTTPTSSGSRGSLPKETSGAKNPQPNGSTSGDEIPAVCYGR